MDQEDELKDRVAQLESAIEFLSMRLSAHEWIVEQHFAHYLLLEHPDKADQFLDGISNPPSTWRSTEEGKVSTRPDEERGLQIHVRHIAEKVRERIRQGIRTG